MKNIISIIACAAILSISAAIPSQVVTSTPALPKVVRHQSFYNINEMNEYVGECVRDGFIIKAVCMTKSSYSDNYYVIAEKY